VSPEIEDDVMPFLRKNAMVAMLKLPPRPEAEGYGDLYNLEVIKERIVNEDFNGDPTVFITIQGKRDVVPRS